MAHEAFEEQATNAGAAHHLALSRVWRHHFDREAMAVTVPFKEGAIAAPVGSVTTPEISPVPNWALID